MRSLALALVAAVVACSSASDPSGSSASAVIDDDDGELLVADPSSCPAPYDTRAPAAGMNSGFTAAGQSRKFYLALPPASFTGPRPVLFAFHGTTETGTKFYNRARLADFVARGFIVVAPDAVGNGFVWPVWDGMRPSGTETEPNADVELFDRLLACTAAHHAVDRKRVYAAGHSAGGIFTNRILRSRSNVVAGGIVGSGVFDLTSNADGAPLDRTLAIVTWGGDNDTYRGTTPGGVSVPHFSFVEQASLATRYYDAQPGVGHVRCRGNDVGHAWLPLNAWFIDLLLAHPKGSSTAVTLRPLPSGARAACSTDPYTLPPLPAVTCGAAPRTGCRESCQLFADCAVENRTLGPSLAPQLDDLGLTATSCGTCPATCQATATTADDAEALACFARKQASAACGPGLEGAAPLFDAINECCDGREGSRWCTKMCRSLLENESADVFLPTCVGLLPVAAAAY